MMTTAKADAVGTAPGGANPAVVLSRCLIHVRDRGRARQLYRAHLFAMGLFSDRAGRGCLFRVLSCAPRVLELLILSAGLPDLFDMRSGNGRVISPHRVFISLLPAAGETVRFRLRLNATAERDDRRLELSAARPDRAPNDLYRDYINRQLAGAATVDRVEVERITRVMAWPPRGRPMTWYVADTRGLLTVHDADAFRERILAGIGRAKAFGCGLMVLEGWPV